MKPRVACFLYYFPPSGGPGVLRGLKFVKYLPDLGFEPVVVTVRESTYAHPGEYAPDPSTLAEVPPDVEVRRVPSFEPVRLKQRLERLKLMRLAQFVLYPLFWERQAMWVLSAIREGVRLAREKRVDLLYTCCGPYCSNLVGLHLTRKLGIPWVTDHRDPWSQGWHLHWPSRLHHRVCEDLEARVLGATAGFVANTPGQRTEILDRFPAADRTRVHAITNGYDEADFAGPAPRGDPDRFVILHAGSFDDRSAAPPPARWARARRWLKERVEHRNRQFDQTTHSPRDLFAALALIKSRHPETYGRIEARLVGAVPGGWPEAAERAGLSKAVRFLGPEAHRSAVGRMRSAALLLLTTTSRRDGRRVSRVSQKTYEYLRAGPPILVSSGASDALDFVLEAGAGTAVAPGDAEGMAAAILDGYRAWSEGRAPSLERDEARILRFERRRLTGDLARVFREALVSQVR
ncbi:MAG: glycosyltransferase [Planctomycetota bacterium]|jgi:glycosyltransferase involved in cell wall biosynthesis